MMSNHFVHQSAHVDDGAVIGAGTKIWHFCHVMADESSSLGQNVVVMSKIRIGDNVKIRNKLFIYEGLDREDDVFCGPFMAFTNVMNPPSHVSRRHEYRRTLVRRGDSTGANATVDCGASLGEYCSIGADAVVTKDLPAYATMARVPARRIGWQRQCGEKLPKEGASTCASCGKSYESTVNGLRRVSDVGAAR